jgi:hypothetical protein
VLLKNWLYNNKKQFSYKAATLLSCCFVVLCLTNTAQINMVKNPSFENISACPNFYNQIKLATGWDTLKSGGGGGPDMFNNCANPSTNYGVPTNLYGISYQIPKSGMTYSNMSWYITSPATHLREYIQTELLQPLVTGRTYCVKFYVSLSNRSRYSIDELGAYFDDGSIYAPYYAPALVNPQIKSPTGVFYSDTLNWMKVEGLYTATANHSYLTLGNFKSQAATNYTVAYPSSTSIVADYYTDDVSVIDVTTPAYAGRDTLLCTNDSVFLGRTPEIGLDCQWFNNSNVIGEGAGIWVKPSNTQTYIVKQDLCGIIDYDTVTVAINPTCFVGINELNKQTTFEVYPNPTNSILNIKSNNQQLQNATIEIKNTLGQIVYMDVYAHQINISYLPSGIYFIILNNKESKRTIKFVKD